MKSLYYGALAAVLALMPVLTFAQTGNQGADLSNIETLVTSIGRLINLATPIIVGLALLAFFWGLVKYIFSAGEDDKGAGKSLMIGGIIAIFVMVSIVGIVKFIQTSFGIADDSDGSFNTPGVTELDPEYNP